MVTRICLYAPIFIFKFLVVKFLIVAINTRRVKPLTKMEVNMSYSVLNSLLSVVFIKPGGMASPPYFFFL